MKEKLGAGWIFDGNTLAWSQRDIGEFRININLDQEEGKTPRKGREGDVQRVIIRLTNQVDVDILRSLLGGNTDPSVKTLEAATILDHIMRESPSRRLTSIKRSFFNETSKRHALGGHVDHTTGVYQSLRVAHHPGGHRFVVNVDVANGTFWTPSDLWRAVSTIARLPPNNEGAVSQLLRNNNPKFNELKRLHRLRVYASHRNGKDDDYTIAYFLKQDSSHQLTMKDGKMTVRDYFQKAYNIRLRHPEWPVVQMNKKAVLPLELLKIKPMQRYQYKLDENQTSAMIKEAVTPPKSRWAAIQHGVDTLDWRNDQFLNNYGLIIDKTPISVDARLIQNPKLQFSGPQQQHDPRTTGRWDLRGKKFQSTPPQAAFGCWGVCIIPSARGTDPGAMASAQKFVKQFLQAYSGHGAQLSQSFQSPVYHQSSNADPASAADEIYRKTGNQFKAKPQILMFILPDKNSTTYGKIKRYCECKLGVVSQCVQWAQVQKCQGQYISNVLMKFNAKLGGFTNTAAGPKTTHTKGHLDDGTVIIGADVSHAAPGVKSPSMAAMTVSMNKLATRYAAACQINGERLEMISDDNIRKHLIPLIRLGWAPKCNSGALPKYVFYFRDGVSEGQFAQVIDQEVAAMKKALAELGCNPQFMVIIASKRHHVRFFPGASGDKNENPLPGTLVETGVTQPFENDFYLCSHVAIKGTARPVHYNVLLNEPNWPNERIQTLIYEHCYQYIRATTPVSLFPAVYYAHIASNRAAHHSKQFGVAPQMQTPQDGSTKVSSAEPLMEMGQPAIMNPSMWYI